MSGFAGLALAFWRTNRNSSLEDFGTFFTSKLNSQLIANGVPRVSVRGFGPDVQGATGGFRHESWSIGIDLAKSTSRPHATLATKIGDLTASELAGVASICYHEARHAEQRFLVARRLASEAKGTKDAKAIATELEIPEAIAAAALKAWRNPLPKDQRAIAEQLRALTKSGRHHDYHEWNETFRRFVKNAIASLPEPTPSGVEQVTAAWRVLTPTIASWRKDRLPFANTKIRSLTKAKKRGAVDDQVLRDLRKIRAVFQKVIKADEVLRKEIEKFQSRAAKKRQSSKREQTKLEIRWLDLEIAIRALWQATETAEESYPEEADASAVQHALKKAVLSKSTSGPDKP